VPPAGISPPGDPLFPQGPAPARQTPPRRMHPLTPFAGIPRRKYGLPGPEPRGLPDALPSAVVHAYTEDGDGVEAAPGYLIGAGAIEVIMTAAQLKSLAIYRKHKGFLCAHCQEARKVLSDYDSQPRVCGLAQPQ